MLDVGLSAILDYYLNNYLSLFFPYLSQYTFKIYKTYVSKYKGRDHEKRSICGQQDEPNKIKYYNQKRLEQIAKNMITPKGWRVNNYNL